MLSTKTCFSLWWYKTAAAVAVIETIIYDVSVRLGAVKCDNCPEQKILALHCDTSNGAKHKLAAVV